MEQLNLPSFDIKLKQEGDIVLIFDFIRKKYLQLTPEEWVRQNFLHYMVQYKGYAKSLLSVEHSLKVHTMQRRADIVAFDSHGKPVLIVECKATSVKIDQKVFDQIARYNIPLQVPYLVVTNGLQHYSCHINFNNNSYQFIQEVPDYNLIR